MKTIIFTTACLVVCGISMFLFPNTARVVGDAVLQSLDGVLLLPQEGVEALFLWVLALCALLIFAGTAYEYVPRDIFTANPADIQTPKPDHADTSTAQHVSPMHDADLASRIEDLCIQTQKINEIEIELGVSMKVAGAILAIMNQVGVSAQTAAGILAVKTTFNIARVKAAHLFYDKGLRGVPIV